MVRPEERSAIAAEPRINDRIRAPKVRLVAEDGDQVGIVDTSAALQRAGEVGLDLVEVAPQADPPVVKIMDYGKWKYEQDVKAKEARKRQSQIHVKEMRFRPKISTHDYETKRRKVHRFLEEGDKVKIILWFRGREMAHTDLGEKLLSSLADDLEDVATVETRPKLDGRNMTMVLAPLRSHGKSSEKGNGGG